MELSLFAIVCMAIVVEGLISYARMIVVDKKLQWQVVAGIVLGIVVAIAYQLDLMAVFGLVSIIPWFGCILTGVMISRGSNYIFELIKLIINITSMIKSILIK